MKKYQEKENTNYTVIKINVKYDKNFYHTCDSDTISLSLPLFENEIILIVIPIYGLNMSMLISVEIYLLQLFI